MRQRMTTTEIHQTIRASHAIRAFPLVVLGMGMVATTTTRKTNLIVTMVMQVVRGMAMEVVEIVEVLLSDSAYLARMVRCY